MMLQRKNGIGMNPTCKGAIKEKKKGKRVKGQSMRTSQLEGTRAQRCSTTMGTALPWTYQQVHLSPPGPWS